MEILEFKLICLMFAYIAFVYAQSMFINGVHISGSGGTRVLPDGTEKDSEMILYPLHKWLSRKYSLQKFYSYGPQAFCLTTKVNAWAKSEIITYEGTDQFKLSANTTLEEIQKILNNTGFKETFVIAAHNKPGYVLIYESVEQYIVSKWIRKPLIQCIICMASFWGFFTYWIPVYLIFGITIPTVILWVANTFILAFLNYKIYKPK